MSSKKITQTYQVLDEIEHIRKRTGMYAGSVAEQASTEWVYNLETKKMQKQEISYIPALVKIFSEILDNSIDESRRAPEVLDTIRVSFEDDGTITIQDNGRGIPVEVHPQTGQYIAETVFSNLRAGSNFNDEEDAQLIGTNGVGSTITSVLSSYFRIESCDGKRVFRQEFKNGLRERGNPSVKDDDRNRTKITFTPDYAFFKQPGLTEGNRLRMIKKVVDAAACNPSVKFYVNGDRIAIKDFDDYVSLYAEEFVSDLTPDWKVAISASDGFEQVSFINSVETYQGGTHIDYVMIQITNRVREFIKKKHRIEVKPADIRGHMRVYIAANVNRPRFSSQTKENMISPVSDWKTGWTAPDKMINKIVKSSIIQSILDWAEAKAKAAEMAELRKLNKDAAKTNPKRVEKFDDALEKVERWKCGIFFTEGDSARLSIQSARGKNPYIGSFSLRGKPLNTYGAEIKDVVSNQEFANMLVATGLQLGERVISKESLRFGKLIVLSDADLDGFHVSSLLLSFWAKFWPELYEMGMVYRMKTPVYIATTANGQLHEFFDEDEYEAWQKTAPKHRAEYFKGLGGFDTPTFERFINNNDRYLVQISKLETADLKKFELAFSGSEADSRKQWLEDIRYFDVTE